MWNNKVKHQTHRNRVKKWFPGMGGGKNRERSKPPAMDRISPEELKYNIMTIVDNTALYIEICQKWNAMFYKK